MTFKQKVVWSEGMFLRPQHFQQEERYFEFLVHHRARLLSAHYWGFHSFELDEDALTLGVVAIRRAEGVFPDGTAFSIPDHSSPPLELDVPQDVRSSKICLAVAPLRQGMATVAFGRNEEVAARNFAQIVEVADCNSVGGPAAEIQIGDLSLRLVVDSQVPAGWPKLGVLHVIERQANNVLAIDRDYIPPSLCVKRQSVLAGMNREVAGLLNQRVDALARRLADPGSGGITEVSDFLLLSLANRWKPVIDHFVALDGLHPERMYSEFLAIAGELSTYSSKTRCSPAFSIYDHDDLAGTFRPVFASIRHSLSIVLEQNAIRIELSERSYGVHLGQVNDRNLFSSANFVLAATANVAPEQVRAQLPGRIKVGPPEKIRDLVNLHLPGIGLRPLPVAPRELPYNAGFNYFEMDTSHELWRELAQSGSLALHISGSLPGLQIECWAIKKN
jgi:type VI secretion system protein ImpJ